MKAMYGLADHEMGTDSQEFWDRVHPADLPGLRAVLKAHLERRFEQAEAECRVLHKDGSWRWLCVRGRVQFGAGGDAGRDFAMTMRSHHQGAVSMARAELEHGKDPELKKMARKMVGDQEKEIRGLSKWLDRHPPQAAQR